MGKAKIIEKLSPEGLYRVQLLEETNVSGEVARIDRLIAEIKNQMSNLQIVIEDCLEADIEPEPDEEKDPEKVEDDPEVESDPEPYLDPEPPITPEPPPEPEEECSIVGSVKGYL